LVQRQLPCRKHSSLIAVFFLMPYGSRLDPRSRQRPSDNRPYQDDINHLENDGVYL
jgi:hypothetical protein